MWSEATTFPVSEFCFTPGWPIECNSHFKLQNVKNYYIDKSLLGIILKLAYLHFQSTNSFFFAERDNSDESDPEIIEIEQKEWWQDFCDGDELDNIQNSGKLSLLFHLLKECEEIGDKILIFSQSLYTLNCIEYFLEKIDEATNNGETEKFGGYSGTWHIGLDYFRLDGSSSCDNRALWCDMFNNTDNPRARLFLISTKAGGLGNVLFKLILFSVRKLFIFFTVRKCTSISCLVSWANIWFRCKGFRFTLVSIFKVSKLGICQFPVLPKITHYNFFL